jgi:hypothetical protein
MSKDVCTLWPRVCASPSCHDLAEI